jgi:hypothetical protein
MTARDLCQSCEAMIATARSSLAEGAVLDLKGLDAEVERVCASLLLLPKEERGATADALQRLTAALDDLANAVAEQQAELRDSTERVARGRAAQAYGHTRNETG